MTERVRESGGEGEGGRRGRRGMGTLGLCTFFFFMGVGDGAWGETWGGYGKG